MDNTDYYDYYTPHLEEHEKANQAETIASPETVCNKLKEIVSTMEETISSSVVTEENCRAIKTYNNNIRINYNKVLVAGEFAESFADVEKAYVELKQECDFLKEYDEELKVLCNSAPNKDNYYEQAYIIGFIPSGQRFKQDEYDRDYRLWERKVKALKKSCEDLSNNIDDYVEYLKSVDQCDIKDGAITVSMPRPEFINGAPYYETVLLSENDARASRLLEDYGFETIRKLEGEELYEYCQLHGIGPNRENGVQIGWYDSNNQWVDGGRMSYDEFISKYNVDLDVYVVSRTFNGVTFDVAIVYDNTKTEDEHKAFEQQMIPLVDELSLTPPATLQEILDRNHGMIKVDESPVCDALTIVNDKGDLSYYGGGYMGFNQDGSYRIVGHYCSSWGEDYYRGMYLHETGHAYDAFSYSQTEVWRQCSEQETEIFLKTFAPNSDPPDWSAMNDGEKNAWYLENFANVYREYARDPERLRVACPQFYAEMDRIVNETEAYYQQGGEN